MYLLFRAIDIFCTVLQYAILFEVILSWIPGARQSVVGNMISTLTGPILNPIRRLLYNSPLGGPGMMIDFSPIFAYLILSVIQSLV